MRQKKRCLLAEDILKNFPGDSVFLYPNLGKDAKIERGFRKEDLRGGIRRGEGGDARREGEGGGSGEERSALHGRLLMCGPADSFTIVFSKKHHRSKELPDKTDGPSLQRTAAGGGTFSRDRDIPSARRRLWGRWSSDRDSDRTK